MFQLVWNVNRNVGRYMGGPGTFGDLAVASPDGRFIYATFDSCDRPGRCGEGGPVSRDGRDLALSGRRQAAWHLLLHDAATTESVVDNAQLPRSPESIG